jgi:hypothetical protein
MSAIVSCGDDPQSLAGEGAILVEANTQGNDLDQDGYLVSVDNGQPVVIETLGTIYIEDLEAGEYEVSLDDIASNCTIPQAENPQTATVRAADTVEVVFDITCVTPGGGGGPVP